ncbi:MAG TPA: hypothetical protein PKW37_01045 [Salinivirgaceae bacterium]|nr:hypothetical protein [Salinivirgaceae bacterium]
MKVLRLFLASLLLLGVTTLSGCKKEDPEPTKTTGALVVKVKLEGSTGYLQGVLVGIATSKANLDNSVYLSEKETDANGSANFGELAPGNYYYDCYHEIGSDEYYGEGQVQIVANQDLELTLILVAGTK